MLLDEMLKTDWELYLKDWGVELTLEILREFLVPESGKFQREIESVQVQGIMLDEKVKPYLENRVSYPDHDCTVLIGRDQIPVGQSLLVCNLLAENQRYEIVKFDTLTYFVQLYCKNVGELP